MNKLVFILILSIFFLDWDSSILPRFVKLWPEGISLLALLTVIGRIALKTPVAFQGKYVSLFGMLFVLVLVGIVLNKVDPGVVVNGARLFLKYIPIFLLPAVYNFSDREMSQQLKLLLGLLIFQLPVALYQRFVQFAGYMTGDVIGGTLGNSKVLSAVLLWGLAVTFGFYLKGRMRYNYFIIVGFILFVPTVLNETAGTLFFLPLAFLVPVLFADLGEHRARYIMTAVISGSLLLVVLVGVYDHYYGDRWGRGGIMSLITEGKVLEYETRERSDEQENVIGRFAAVGQAITTLWKQDPIMLLLGVGIGNASDSFADSMKGAYYEKYFYQGIDRHLLSAILWTFGLVGVSLFILFCLFIFGDAKSLVHRKDLAGAMALGGLGVIVIFTLQAIYMNALFPNVLGFLFAYFSGYIAAKRVWLVSRRLG